LDTGSFIRFCDEGEVEEGAPVFRSIMGKPVGVFRRSDGSVHALEMTCKHQGADLGKGKIEDGIVTCPRHGWTYDIATGDCISYPDGLPLRAHEVKVEDGKILVSPFPGAFRAGKMPWE